MDVQILLLKIINANKPEEVFTRKNYKKEYLQYLKLIHPDVCSLTGASEAAMKLNQYRKVMETLDKIEDDAGTCQVVDGLTLIIKGEQALLLKSKEHYQRLMGLSDPASNHFKKYLPTDITYKEDSLIIRYPHRIIPLANLTLPQEHVTWILSRMLEFVSWLHQAGFSHNGINPESICVVPETHGIVCVSFYHMTSIHYPVQTISGRYLNWYPSVVFDEKKAIPYIDVTLAKRTALYLLGDQSGNGVKLKKTHHEQLIDFLISPHYNAFSTFDQYRNLLINLFGKPKFHQLDI